MKNLIPLLLMLFFLALLAISVYYISKRFTWMFHLEQGQYLYFVFGGLLVFMFVGMIALSNATSIFGSMLYIAAAGITGIMLYLLLSLLLVDLIHIWAKFTPRIFKLLTLLPTLLICIYGIINAANTRISSLETTMPGLEEEVCIMHWSDVHIGHFRGSRYIQRLVDKTKAQQADFLVITGDLFDGRIRMKEESLEPLKQLKIPVYFVEGNHDGYTGVSEIKILLRKLGIIVLENEIALQSGLQLIGLNHMAADSTARSMHTGENKGTIKEVLGQMSIQESRPAILLHHSPDGAEYAAEKGIDLYLAGHTHGGQLFPVNYLNNLIFKYNMGVYKYKELKIYVSMGAGTFGPPMRIGTKSEITCHRLLPDSSN